MMPVEKPEMSKKKNTIKISQLRTYEFHEKTLQNIFQNCGHRMLQKLEKTQKIRTTMYPIMECTQTLRNSKKSDHHTDIITFKNHHDYY